MYDVVIVGSGPAGLTAALYASRYNLKTIVVSKDKGGTLAKAPKIENWPGIKAISGMELMQQLETQVKELGTEFSLGEVVNVSKHNNAFKILTQAEEYNSKFLLLATGCKRRSLGVAGEKEFYGKGVSYCATCDAPLFKDKVVAVVGGSNAAAVSAELLSNYAAKVYIIYRRERIRADPLLRGRIEDNTKIEIITSSNIVEICGNKFVSSVKLDKGNELKVDGVFIEIGSEPCVELAKQLGVKLDSQGFIVVDSSQKTTMPNVYAAGDNTTSSNKFEQAITAAAEGAIAASSIYEESKRFPS